MADSFILYSHYKSTASHRIRIALNIKKIPYKIKTVEGIRNNSNKAFAEDYKKKNPQLMVPTLIDLEENILTQSISIIEYLEERYPQPALLPRDPIKRAYVRQLACMIACDMHPLNTLRVRRYLERHLNLDELEKSRWYQNWVVLGLKALEETLVSHKKCGRLCLDDQLSIADVFLIPQLHKTLRIGLSIDIYHNIHSIYKNCIDLEEFIHAHPDNQPNEENT